MNTDCHAVRQMFERLLDGELSREEESLVTEHTKTCPSCRDALQGEMDVITMFEHLPELECPEHVLENIRETVRSREKASLLELAVFPVLRTLRRPLVLAAAAAAIVAFLFIRIPEPATRRPDRIAEVPAAYSPEEIRRARTGAKWTLAFTAKQVSRAEEAAARAVLLDYLPRTVKKGIRSSLRELPGGAV